MLLLVDRGSAAGPYVTRAVVKTAGTLPNGPVAALLQQPLELRYGIFTGIRCLGVWY